METPLLAAALIVKNEEKFLPDCLASLNALRPLLSEICVYDTGSTDRTIEIAEAAGARVHRGYWDQDFSRARNAAIDMCQAKWVLIVDADERVVANGKLLRSVLRDALVSDMVGVDSLVVQVKNMLSEKRMDSSWPSIRLLRPSRMHYEGRLHEQVMPRRARTARRDSLLDEAILHLLHFGYAGESVGQVKGARNVSSADLEVAAARLNSGAKRLAAALLDRGRSHILSGNNEAAVLDLAEVRSTETGTSASRWAGEDLVTTLIALGRLDEARTLLRELRAEGIDPQMGDWFDALLAWDAGNHIELRRLLSRIDQPESSGSMTLPISDIVEMRFLNSVVLGEADEAIACAIRLMASHGRGAGHGELVLDLWGERPLHDLAQLLFEADRGFLRGMAEEFMQYPPRGTEVAASLVSLSQAQAARSIASVESMGDSFGIHKP